MSHQIHTYTELRQQIHNDLRIQHPEWVQLNGESPMCDSYEARLAELFENFTRTGERSGLRTHTATTESVSLCVRQQNGKEMRGRNATEAECLY